MEISVESHRIEVVVSDVSSLYCVHHSHKQRTHKKYIGNVCTDTLTRVHTNCSYNGTLQSAVMADNGTLEQWKFS